MSALLILLSRAHRIARRALLAALAVALAWTLVPLSAAQDGRRVLAVGDIHGAYDEFAAILEQAGLIDARQHWTGGSAILVQTGDFTDRGAEVRRVMDLLIALEGRAKQAGGEVVTLLGNHEVMNLIGDVRDVNPDACRAFADGKSEARREQEWTRYAALVKARARVRADLPPVYQKTRDEWMAAHPVGCLEYREALGPRGAYGKWLRSKSIAAIVDGSLFMHAGINPDHPPATVNEVNARARDEIARYDAFLRRMTDAGLALPSFTINEVLQAIGAELAAAGAIMDAARPRDRRADLSGFDVQLLREGGTAMAEIGNWSLVQPEGPLWFRGYATWEESAADKVRATLTRLGASRIVVGHTPTQQLDYRIVPRFGGLAILIDTGMLASVYKGRESALEIRGGRLSAIYLDEVIPLQIATPH